MTATAPDCGLRLPVDPTVTICPGAPSMRFSIVGNSASYDFEESQVDTRFTKLQRELAHPAHQKQLLPGLDARREDAALTFALFQVPWVWSLPQLNSGGGGLSTSCLDRHSCSATQLIISTAFEQGNGAAELGGPVLSPGRSSTIACLLRGAQVASATSAAATSPMRTPTTPTRWAARRRQSDRLYQPLGLPVLALSDAHRRGGPTRRQIRPAGAGALPAINGATARHGQFCVLIRGLLQTRTQLRLHPERLQRHPQRSSSKAHGGG